MKKILLAAALVTGTVAAASAQTPMGTPPSGTLGQTGVAPPSGSSSRAKPDATVDTQVNDPGANQANPADRNARRMRKSSKGGKMKTKSQSSTSY